MITMSVPTTIPAPGRAPSLASAEALSDVDLAEWAGMYTLVPCCIDSHNARITVIRSSEDRAITVQYTSWNSWMGEHVQSPGEKGLLDLLRWCQCPHGHWYPESRSYWSSLILATQRLRALRLWAAKWIQVIDEQLSFMDEAVWTDIQAASIRGDWSLVEAEARYRIRLEEARENLAFQVPGVEAGWCRGCDGSYCPEHGEWKPWKHGLPDSAPPPHSKEAIPYKRVY